MGRSKPHLYCPSSAAVDDERALAALAMANLSEFVETELPDGLDIHLSDRGVRLSGGKRQRVAIARAPSFLVLDEATNSLDANSEHSISTALSRISRQKAA